MANRFPILSSSPKQLSKHLHSYLPSIYFSTVYPHPRGHDDEGGGVTGFMADAAKQGTMKAAEVVESVDETAKETVDFAWDSTKKATQNINETTTAEADTNVVDTAEYRCAEDLTGQLGDGCDKTDL